MASSLSETLPRGRLARATDADPQLKVAFLEAVGRSGPRCELDGISESQRDRMLELAFEAAFRRPPGTHKVLVGVGETEAGQRLMPVALVTDDLPFLVDSATAVISRAGLEIACLLHPVLSVKRADDGTMLGVGGAQDPRESVIVMEVERAPARRRAELQADLDAVYRDVRLAVGDWKPMVDRLLKAARLLNDRPPPVAPHVLAETIAFLEWLAADNFTFLGCLDEDGPKGVLRDAERFPAPDAAHGDPTSALIISKSRLVSTVHRAAPMDMITVRHFDSEGKVAGSAVFLGLFTSAALNESPRRVPLIRRKVAHVTERLGYDARGHSGKALAHVLETFPRDELFQIDGERLQQMAEGLLSLLDRPRPRLFLNMDLVASALSALVYIPRDSYSAEVRERVGTLLAERSGGTLARYDVELRGEGLARVHYVLHDIREFLDEDALNAELERLTKGWDEALEQALVDRVSPLRAARLAITHGRAFSAGYRSEFTPAEAADDILRLADLSTPADRDVKLYARDDDPDTTTRLKIYRLGEIIPLSEAVPMLENFGFRVIEEVPFDLAGGKIGWIHDFRLEGPPRPADFAAFARRLEPALDAVLTGIQENDPFNALIPAADLSAEEANWFRAWFRYLRQTGVSYGIATVVDVLKRNAKLTRVLAARFRARFGPQADSEAESAADAQFAELLAGVTAIDDDRILTLFRELVGAMLRTNAFVVGGPEALAFKLDSAKVPGLPKPKPWREIWVYSPRVEGIHLRGGRIARGGLRWSDRRDDFRTEVLGLVKAQVVKNAVIVPTGAKGGFYPKQLPDPARREAWLAEGEESYRIFIRALLSITDNLDADGKVVPPENVVRHDEDDPYLVVAADKGTATFSDIANQIAEKHGFWLGDAFASGGSAGYDHKAMGITARGAWVSVTRHFAEIGVDVAKDPVTVAGVGDMSGDVFGNGMLLSKALKLVAAFDHRHIFLDPDPDPAESWKERKRLFGLGRSSWADYDPGRISKGGGVFPRSQKSIPLSKEVKRLLGVEEESLSPTDLIRAILKAEVDLLWFGGIGTYVKAAAETHQDVGDRANDPHRVDAEELRAKVIGEGANLGVTQRGRIAFALAGGRVNTDFIDNSAGVDTSDNEVNIKIALGKAMAAGTLTRDARDRLLERMADEVARLVLSHNSAQTLALSIAEHGAANALPGHVRFMMSLEARGRLDRAVEHLPDSRELEDRRRAGKGLTRPELAILLSYAKMDLKEAVVASEVVEDPLLEPDLVAAFPTAMREDFRDGILKHPLRRELIATRLASELVDRGGLTLAHSLAAELGVELKRVAAAHVAARQLFALDQLWDLIAAAKVEEPARLALFGEMSLALRALVADLAVRTGAERPSALVGRLQPPLERIEAKLDRLLRPEPRAQVEAVRQRLQGLGAPQKVTDRIARFHALTGAVGIAALSTDLGLDETDVAMAYTRLGEALSLDWARGAATTLRSQDAWERLLLAGVVRSFETMRLDLMRRIIGKGGDPVAAVEAWLSGHRPAVDELKRVIASARATTPTLAMVAHLANVARVALQPD
ncbi:MAG: NAD-glutamate dehydrogenase [Sphingomonadaceae bacterium]